MKLFYRRYGAGPALIILHGLYGSSDNWVTIARKLSDRFTIVLPDLRNHGLSPHSDRHDYDSMSNDLLELADNLKFGRFFLAGHSMGGKAAMRFAMKWPEKLNGLLIADISPSASADRTKAALSEHSEILQTILSTDLSSVTSRKEAELCFSAIKPEKIRGLILKNLQRNADNTFSWKINALSLLKSLDKIMEPVMPGESDDQEITGFPVYFLKAANSDYITKDDVAPIMKIFPSACFITIPDAGHWIHADNPEAVISALLKFPGSD
jgi:esterase